MTLFVLIPNIYPLNLLQKILGGFFHNAIFYNKHQFISQGVIAAAKPTAVLAVC